MIASPTSCLISMLCLIAVGASFSHADDMPAADPALPQPLDLSFSQELMANSPFTRAVNLGESLQLTGVAIIDGRPVVTVRDRDTKKSHVLTDVPDAQGWKLVAATPGSDQMRAEAQIMVGREVVNLRYADAQYEPARSGSSKGYMPSKIPTREEYTGHDDKGDYVRGMPYLSDDDRSKMRELPRETREKFLQVVHDARDKLFKASHEERAAFVKKAFDKTMRKR